MDPMAGIGGNGPSPTDQTNSNEREVLDMTAAMANHKKVDTIRSFMGIVSGCVAGILGLTGLEGLGTSFQLLLFHVYPLRLYYLLAYFQISHIQFHGLKYCIAIPAGSLFFGVTSDSIRYNLLQDGI